MECLICKSEAEELTPEREGVHVRCLECGDYMISGSLEKLLGTRSLNMQAARDRLHELRRTGQSPLLTTYDDGLLE